MRKLTVIVVTPNAVGHVNACAGALSQLLSRGHRVIFVLEKAFQGKLKALGYEEYHYESSPQLKNDSTNGKENENPGEKMTQMLVSQKIIGPFSPLEKMIKMMQLMRNPRNREEYKRLDETVVKAVDEFAPDLLYVDGFFCPSVHFSGIPWISNNSYNPLFMHDNLELPPGGSGLPADDSTEWGQFDEIRKVFSDASRINKFIVELGYEPIENVTKEKIKTQAMTVYAYPEELNYEQIRSEGWFNLEVFNKTPKTSFVPLSTLVPEDFLNNTLSGSFSGKLIYVSMGSMGSVDLDLMNRLVSTLGKTAHKYIVSRGPRFSEYELAENMWGDRYLPQAAIVPHVDLVITHGGNNTVTETFVEGKPMIVLPLFADQFDNAQRLKETGLGARIDPYNFTESELIGTIDRLLEDDQLKQKLQTAAKRIQQSDKHQELAIKIEQLFPETRFD